MSVKLRFRRMGRKKLPVYGLVATDSRSPRDGRFIEDLGRYEPVSEPIVVRFDADRVVYWLSQGAQPSDTVRNLLQKEGVLLRWALTRRGEDPEAIEQAVTEFRERRAESQPTEKTRAQRRAEALDAERKAAKERAAELAKERQEREAELQKQREEAEAAARAEAEANRADATAAAADSEALTTAADAPAAPPEGGEEAEGGASETPEAVTTGEPIEQTSSQADGDGDTADQQAEAEAEGGDAAAAEATEAEVADEAPAAAEEQPAVEETDAEEVAADTGDAVADQASAGAEQDVPAEQAEGLATAPEGTADAEPAGTEPPAATEEDSAKEAAPAKPASTGDADKLTVISGIGPKYSGILNDAGLTTFAAVAETSVDRLREIITEAGSTTAGNEETWPEQARLLADGDTDGHAAFVEAQKNA